MFGNKDLGKEGCLMKNKKQPPSIFVLGFSIFNKWMKLKNEGKSLQKFFDDNRIETVAVYGLGALGQRLLEDLEKTDVQVLYAIDKNAANFSITNLCVVTPEDVLKEVDAIIVTPVQYFYEIEMDLEKKIRTDIISLEDVVEYCL